MELSDGMPLSRNRQLNQRSKTFAVFAIGIIATLAVSLVSAALYPAEIGSALLSKGNLPNYTSTLNDSTKLRVILSINTTTLHSGDTIDIQVSEQNTIPFNNTVARAYNWPISGLWGPCGPLDFPMGIAIFQGYHLQNDLPTTNLLTLYNPQGVYNCPAAYPGLQSYTFEPDNDTAALNGICIQDHCPAISMRSGGTYSGYWTDYLFFATFQWFSPGLYTVVGGSEWGDILVLHFVVP
jgi:hypothetical protein